MVCYFESHWQQFKTVHFSWCITHAYTWASIEYKLLVSLLALSSSSLSTKSAWCYFGPYSCDTSMTYMCTHTGIEYELLASLSDIMCHHHGQNLVDVILVHIHVTLLISITISAFYSNYRYVSMELRYLHMKIIQVI